tara:strand:- start:405 stop:1091 length:687 start_codon:yes stop_codon:yes gene_type:complete
MDNLPTSLENLASVIRDIWIRERKRHEEQKTGKPSRYARGGHLPRYDGGEDGMGRTHKPFWPKAAKYVVKHSLNPRRWIKFALETFQAKGYRDRRRFATPNVLVSDALRTDYELYVQELPERLRVELDSQSSTAMLRFRSRARSRLYGPSEEDALRSVLLDLSLPLSALFRYSAAVSGDLHDVAARFFEPALMQYFFEQELYDDAWSGHIPDSLRQAAVEARKTFYTA